MTCIPFRSAISYKLIAIPSAEITLERVKVASDLAGITLSGLTVALAVSGADGITHFESQSVEGDCDLIPFREYKSIELAATHIKTVFDGLGQNKNEEKYKPLKVISEAANQTSALISEARRQMTAPATDTFISLRKIEKTIRTSGIGAVNQDEVRRLYNRLKAHLLEIQLRDQSVRGLKEATDEPFTDAKVGKIGRAREVFNHNQHAATQLLGEEGMSGKSQHELYFEGNMKWLERHFSDLRLGQDDAVSVSEVRSRSGSFVDGEESRILVKHTLQGAPLLTETTDTIDPSLKGNSGPSAPGSERQTSRLFKPPERRKSWPGADHAGPKPMLNSGTNRTAPRNTSVRFSLEGNSPSISTSHQEQHAESELLDLGSRHDFQNSFVTSDPEDKRCDTKVVPFEGLAQTPSSSLVKQSGQPSNFNQTPILYPKVGRSISLSGLPGLPTLTVGANSEPNPSKGGCVTFFQNPLQHDISDSDDKRGGSKEKVSSTVNSSFQPHGSRSKQLTLFPSSPFSTLTHTPSYATSEGRDALKQGGAVNRPFLPRDPDSIDAIDRFDDPISSQPYRSRPLGMGHDKK